MKFHNANIIIWLVIVAQFVAYEVFTLLIIGDRHEPFTFYVRRIAGSWRSPVWYLLAGFLVWLPIHFLWHR